MASARARPRELFLSPGIRAIATPAQSATRCPAMSSTPSTPRTATTHATGFRIATRRGPAALHPMVVATRLTAFRSPSMDVFEVPPTDLCPKELEDIH